MHEPFSLQPQVRLTSLRPAESRKRAWALLLGAALSVALCGAARHELSERASGAAKPKLTENGSIERWGKSEVTITIDDSVREAGPEAVEAVQSAFGNWLVSGAELPRMKFASGGAAKSQLMTPDGKNTVSYAEIDIPGHKKDLALTITFLDPKTGRIQEADIVINTRHGFKSQKALTACGGEYDLESVMSHEVGHFFGLGEDTEDDSTTMFYVTRACDVKKRELKEPDKTSMMLLYSGPGDAEEEEATQGGCSIGERPNGSGSLFWLGALGALTLVARRTRS